MVVLLGAAKSENENLTNAQQIVTEAVPHLWCFKKKVGWTRPSKTLN